MVVMLDRILAGKVGFFPKVSRQDERTDDAGQNTCRKGWIISKSEQAG